MAKQALNGSHFPRLASVSAIVSYIEHHQRAMGFEPSAVALPYNDYLAVIKELGGDGRCTNLTARIHGVRVFCL